MGATKYINKIKTATLTIYFNKKENFHNAVLFKAIFNKEPPQTDKPGTSGDAI